MYPVFLANRNCLIVKDPEMQTQDINLNQPIGQLFIRSEYTPANMMELNDLSNIQKEGSFIESRN